MKCILLAAIGIFVMPPIALADGVSLAGSLWRCTRASDQSQPVLTLSQR